MGVLTSAIEEFETKTGYPLSTYLSDYVSFNATDSILIANYYGGQAQKPNMPSFNKLDELIKQSKRLSEVINGFRDSFPRTDFWDLVELIEDIKTKLETINNSSRWLKSSITKKNFSPTQEVDHTLESRQTLEKVALDLAGSSDKENDWVALALRNDLKEEDYTTGGGTRMLLTTEDSGPSLDSVVDNLTGENIYGKDINRVLTFTDNDLEVLTPQKTIRQAVDILSQLRQGDNPEFSTNGIQTALAVGSNYASFAYPTLFRQLYDTFRSDDTLKSFKVLKLETQQDAIFLEFEVETRMGEFLVQSITI